MIFFFFCHRKILSLYITLKFFKKMVFEKNSKKHIKSKNGKFYHRPYILYEFGCGTYIYIKMNTKLIILYHINMEK